MMRIVVITSEPFAAGEAEGEDAPAAEAEE